MSRPEGRVFLTRRVDGSDRMLARYREVLVDAFDHGSFAQLFAEEVGHRLATVVAPECGLVDKVDRALRSCQALGAPLARLLAGALRCRTEHHALVGAIAPALGLAPLVEVAELLHRRGCPVGVREPIALVVAPGAHRGGPARDGVSGWLDVLLWLDDLPDAVRPRPPVLDYLDRVHCAWSAGDEAGAAALAGWLDRHGRGHRIQPPARDLAAPSVRGILLEFDEHGAVWTCVAYLFGDAPTAMLFHDTMPVPVTEGELSARIAAVVDRCLADATVAHLHADGAELRFEFVLPNRWIAFPVDRVEVGGDEQAMVSATPLGASYPVVVRPRPWWRPRPGSPSYATVLRRFRTKRDHLRSGGAAQICTLSCPTAWTPDQLAIINESRDVVAIALACDRGTLADPDKLARCLRAHVLAIVWNRSGIRAGDAHATALLEALLQPVERAPDIVREQRLRRAADVSLLWHVEPIAPPDHDPFAPPEIAAAGTT
jgi:hypothetical protein